LNERIEIGNNKIKELERLKLKAENELNILSSELTTAKVNIDLDTQKANINSETQILQEKLNKLKQEIGEITYHQEFEESGVYSYKFKFQSVEKYDDALTIIKIAQKSMIQNDKAFSCNAQGLNGSPIIKNLSKLALLAFNSSADL